MAVITRAYSEVSGTVAYASSVNRVVDDLYTLQNGGINSANLAASGVGDLNLQTSAVISRAIDTSAVTTAKLNDGAVTDSKLDHSVKFYQEVFS
jgi:DNA-binding transcriptional regulator LsrR (DeoR family)